MNGLIKNLKGKIIVSCQAYPGEPMRCPETMAQIAAAAEIGGAAAIRCQGLSDISAIKSRVSIPVIGLWKEGHEGVYITPTLRHALACIYAGSDIVAIDATSRKRPDDSSFEDIVLAIKDKTLVMADCSCLDDVKRSIDVGVDIISTTLSGYVDTITKPKNPDYELIEQASKIAGDIPVFCEGRVHTPQQAKKAFESGAYAVVVGTAITHPSSITSWFINAV